MFKKNFFQGAIALCAVFFTLASCQEGYVGPSAEQITNSILNRQKAERLASVFASSFRDYPGYKADAPIETWGQENAAYSFTVNTATREKGVSVALPISYDCNIVWQSTTSNAAFVLNGTLSIAIAASTNTTETLAFTITDASIKKPIIGTLTIATTEDVNTVGITAVQREFDEWFEKEDVEFIKTTPISAWGSDVEYGIKYPSYSQGVDLHLPDSLPSGATVIWKQKSNAMDGDGLTVSVSDGYYFKGQNTNTTADKNAVLDFQIVNNDNSKIITGMLIITASKYDAAAAALSSLKSTFSGQLSVVSLSKAATLKDFWIDTPITTWGQTDAKYSLKVKADSPDGNTFYFPASFSGGSISWKDDILGTGDYSLGPSDPDSSAEPTTNFIINPGVLADKTVVLKFTATTYDTTHKVEGTVEIKTY
jgi:hypothetical protein